MAFVEVATDEYGLRNRPTNISRTAVLTGLTRKEVKRIRDEIHVDGTYSFTQLGRPAQLLSVWFNNPDFLNADGIPRDLEFEGEGGFRDLCRVGGGDVPPGALLTELKRAKAVEETKDGKIKALTRHFNPAGIDQYQVTRFGECLHDLADTVEFNLSAAKGQQRRFESRAWNDKMSPKMVRRFQFLAREHGEHMLEMLDDWLTANETRSGDSDGVPLKRCGVGIYFFESDDKDG